MLILTILYHKITWLATALVWGIIRVLEDRNLDFDYQTSDPGSYLASESNPDLDPNQDVINAVLKDNSWEFGQVVAVALLMIPFVSFVESIYGKFVRFSITTLIWVIWNHTKRLSPIKMRRILSRPRHRRIPDHRIPNQALGPLAPSY